MTTLAIIFLTLTGISFIVTFLLLILYAYDLVDYSASSVSFIISLMLGIIAICLIVQAEQSKKPKVKKYPLKEWRMDYGVTTINNKSDTTLVLTKIR